MVTTETQGGEKFRVQGGTIMFGRTAAGILVPMLVAADGSLAVSGAGGVAASVGIADGADVAEGTTTDFAVVDPSAPASQIALEKGLLTVLLALFNNSGTVQTPSWDVITADTTIAAGAKAITLVSSEDFEGTVDGTDFPAEVSMTWRAELGRKLDALEVEVVTGSLNLGKVV